MIGPDYTFQFRKVKGHSFIMIEDLNKGGQSVTNGIERVVKEIAKKKEVNPVEFNIIYKDSEGVWDGYNFSTKQVFPLREPHWLKAAIKTVNAI